MKKQLLTLQQLIAIMDPELYRHLGNTAYAYTAISCLLTRRLEKTDGLNLFFCFR